MRVQVARPEQSHAAGSSECLAAQPLPSCPCMAASTSQGADTPALPQATPYARLACLNVTTIVLLYMRRFSQALCLVFSHGWHGCESPLIATHCLPAPQLYHTLVELVLLMPVGL